MKRTTILEFFFFTIHLTLGYLRFFSVDNVYFSNYDARVNRELFEAAPLLILSLFRRRKVGQLFSQALIWEKKATKTFHAFRFTHIWHSVFKVYMVIDYLCLFSYVWLWRHHKPIHLWPSSALKYRASKAGFSQQWTNLFCEVWNELVWCLISSYKLEWLQSVTLSFGDVRKTISEFVKIEQTYICIFKKGYFWIK